MPKFMVLYNSDAKASEVMGKTSPDEMKASMDAWLKWREEASKKFKVDFGLPLEGRACIDSDGVKESDSKVSGYSIIEGDSKEALMDLLKTHPHLKQEGNCIDVFEMLPIPGMEA